MAENNLGHREGSVIDSGQKYDIMQEDVYHGDDETLALYSFKGAYDAYADGVPLLLGSRLANSWLARPVVCARWQSLQ